MQTALLNAYFHIHKSVFVANSVLMWRFASSCMRSLPILAYTEELVHYGHLVYNAHLRTNCA